jgi:hypothetical protein
MFDDDPEWDLAILSYTHDHNIDASVGSTQNELIFPYGRSSHYYFLNYY